MLHWLAYVWAELLISFLLWAMCLSWHFFCHSAGYFGSGVLEVYSGMLNRLPSWSLSVRSKYVYVFLLRWAFSFLLPLYFNQLLDRSQDSVCSLYTHLNTYQVLKVKLLAHDKVAIIANISCPQNTASHNLRSMPLESMIRWTLHQHLADLCLIESSLLFMMLAFMSFLLGDYAERHGVEPWLQSIGKETMEFYT